MSWAQIAGTESSKSKRKICVQICPLFSTELKQTEPIKDSSIEPSVSDTSVSEKKKKRTPKKWINTYNMKKTWNRIPYKLLSFNDKLYAIIINKKCDIEIMEYDKLEKYIETTEYIINYNYSQDPYTWTSMEPIHLSVNHERGKLFATFNMKVNLKLIIYNLYSLKTEKKYIIKNMPKMGSICNVITNNNKFELENQISFNIINHWKRYNKNIFNILPNDIYIAINHYYSYFNQNLIHIISKVYHVDVQHDDDPYSKSETYVVFHHNMVNIDEGNDDNNYELKLLHLKSYKKTIIPSDSFPIPTEDNVISYIDYNAENKLYIMYENKTIILNLENGYFSSISIGHKYIGEYNGDVDVEEYDAGSSDNKYNLSIATDSNKRYIFVGRSYRLIMEDYTDIVTDILMFDKLNKEFKEFDIEINKQFEEYDGLRGIIYHNKYLYLFGDYNDYTLNGNGHQRCCQHLKLYINTL